MNIKRQIAENKRRAISQSMDLFIIIAAVLAVGGVVTAAVYSLAGSASTNSSIQVVSVSLTGGASATSSPVSLAITIKNTGSSSITCSTATCSVVLTGTSFGATVPTCVAPCSVTSSPTGWVTSIVASSPVTFTGGSQVIAPGAQTTLVFNGPFTGTLTTLTGMPVHGSSTAQTINIVIGTASAQTSVLP
jgi:archaellum component FlaG (FlaF/FlaG flagellin family)